MDDLQHLLLDLAEHGHPRLILFDGGWYCSIEMHVAAKGASFKIASDFNHPSPLAAALQCDERVRAVRCVIPRPTERGRLSHG